VEKVLKVPWSKPDIGLAEKKAVQRVMDSGWMSQGPETLLFEAELANYIDCRNVIVVNNGTSALICALLAHQKRGQEIVVPCYTFPATWNAVTAAGMKAKMVDVNRATFIMEPPENGLTLPVSVMGMPLNPDDWEDKIIVEDACESLGSKVGQMQTGGMGWTSCFSFHIAKLITTVEGGAIATDDDDLAYECRLIRSHGEHLIYKYHFMTFGLNFRITDVASAIGRVQLGKLDQYLMKRKQITDFYREELADYAKFQEIPEYVTIHSNMIFPILVKDPLQLAQRLWVNHQIETRRPWPPKIPFPCASQIYQQILAIPLFNSMSLEEAQYVVDCVKLELGK